MAIDTTLLGALIAVTPSPGGYWDKAILQELLDNINELNSGSSVSTDSTLTGDGTATAALSVALPLPAVSAADSLKVLTVVSSTWTAQTPASGLPTITSSTDTLALAVISGATTAVWTAFPSGLPTIASSTSTLVLAVASGSTTASWSLGTPGPTGATGAAGADGDDGADGGFDSVQSIVTVTADKTLALTDVGDLLKVTASAEITIPPNSSVAFDVGQHIDIMAYTANNVDVLAGSGVTLRAPYGGRLKTQYGAATLVKIASDEWVLVGDCEEIV